MTAAVIIQARMGSSRLPGKSLATLGDTTVLDWVVDRCELAVRSGSVIVATTTGSEDDPIVGSMTDRGVIVVRGSDLDVLDRYRQATDSVPDADVIVRVTADCPLVEPGLIRAGIELLAADPELDYVSTSLDGRYPRGFDVEVVRRSVLLRAARDATADDEREHVTLHVYRRPERYTCRPLSALAELHRPDMRVTVDEPADLDLVRAVVDGLRRPSAEVTGADVIAFLDANPAIAGLNRHVRHNNVS